MDPLIAGIFYLVAILILCAFAINEALVFLHKRPPKEIEAIAAPPAETNIPETPKETSSKDKQIEIVREAVQHFAAGIFPAGCKFYHDNGELTPGGELLAAILADKRGADRIIVSPCEGCAYRQKCATEGRFKPKENRLNTDNLEVRPLSQEETLLLAQILLSSMDDAADWALDPDNGFDTNEEGEKLETPWIIRVIRKRITGENLKIAITKKAYFLLMVITESNPGKAMFTLHKIGNLLEKGRTPKWLVTSEVITSSLFPFGVPTEEAWDKWWDSQKVSRNSGQSWSDNLVDVFPQEWKKK